MAVPISFFGVNIPTSTVLITFVSLSLFFMVLGLLRDWHIKIGPSITLYSRELLFLGSFLIIIGAFAFNGFIIVDFFLYYYEMGIILLYSVISLTLLPSAAAVLLGVLMLSIWFILIRKKSDIPIGKWTIPPAQASNLLIAGFVLLISSILLSQLYQPKYDMYGTKEDEGTTIARIIEPLSNVFSRHLVTALSDFHLHQIIYVYPLVLLFCGIYTLKLSINIPSHTIFDEKFKESIERIYKKFTRFMSLAISILLLLTVASFISVALVWVIGLDSNQLLYDSLKLIFQNSVGLVILSLVIFIFIYLPKGIRPFLDSRTLRYAARRMLSMVPMFIGISIICYTLMASTGNPVDLIISGIPPGRNRVVVYENLMRIYGLNAPIHSQWFNWFFHFAMGDLGNSIINGRFVFDEMFTRLIPTLELSIIPLLLALFIAIPFGIYAALKQYAWQDNVVAVFASFSLAIPIFLLILLLVIAFGFYIPILPPAQRNMSIEAAVGVDLLYVNLFFNTFINEIIGWYTWDLFFHLVIPIIAVTSVSLALYVRLIRSGYLEVIQQDYILSAQAYGFRDKTIIFRHSLRNVLIPIVTYIGITIGGLLGGAPLTETTLSWPGLGAFGVQAILAYDYPVVMGLIMVTAVLILFANLFTDLIYSVIDPRVTL